jgi:septal ring factor EnvC (AmiA/AmiB activator)
VREYENAEKEYQDQVDMRCKLEMEQKDLELRLANLEESHGDAEEKKNIENELAALKVTIQKKDVQIENALKVYEKLLEKAQRMVVITPEKVKLAEKMYHVANAVSDNLSKAVVSIPTVMSKTVVDALYLSRHMGQFPQIANVMAHEVKQKAQTEDRDPMEIAQKRLELIGSRGVHFLPDLITISSAVYTQYNLYTPKKEYLAKLVEEGDGNIQASSWLF